MYYEERLINGVAYFRHTPNGKWIEKVIDKGVHAGSMTMPVKNCLIADVVGQGEQCCSNPKHKTEVNELFENWVECKNCGKEII